MKQLGNLTKWRQLLIIFDDDKMTIYKVQNAEFREIVIPSKNALCTISKKNIVAATTFQDVENRNSFRNHVTVCDIVSPWQSFRVVSSSPKNITCLEWNNTGELLLVAYEGGIIEIWSTRNQLLNLWQLMYKATFPGEDIIQVKFFHSGKCVYFHSQKKESPSYAEKFERLDYRPTVTQFGGAPVEGVIVVTASGLLGAFIIPKLSSYVDYYLNNQCIELNTVTHSIGLSRYHIAFASIMLCPSGCFKLAVSCGLRKNMIHLFKASVQLEPEDNITIICESLSSLFLSAIETKRIRYLHLTSVGNEDTVFIGYDCGDGSLLEQWNFTKKHFGVHKLLQKTKGDFIQCELWENTAQLHLSAKLGGFCLSKLVSDHIQIFAVLADNSVHIMEPGLKTVGITMFDRLTNDRVPGYKFASADVSYMNQILAIFDDAGQMYAMQVSSPHLDKPFKPSTIFLQVSLLEYCIITGIDASDILMLNLGSLDVLIEKLTENFTRQPAFTRHFFYSNFLSLKSNMCRIQSKQQDFDNLILLHSISITFKSLLRPSDLSCQDKGPADNLAIILSEPLPDVDKVLFNLDAKDFTVEPFTLQSIQQLIQWVADLALNILNRLPDEVMKSKLRKKQGYDISRDIVAIGSIRELLVMIRIWGLLNSQCLPIYTKSVENVDVLSILFRLLTRLAQNTTEPDEMLLDECSVLSTQVLIPSRHFSTPTTLLNCHNSVIKSLPLIFTASIEPVGLQEAQMEEVVFSNGIKDSVSNLQLGSKTRPLRRCIRCGFVNSLQKVAKTSALKAWHLRWIYCHCGGFWKQD